MGEGAQRGRWRTARIADLGRVVTGRTPPGTLAKFFGDAIPFLTPSDMDGSQSVGKTMRSLSEEGIETLKRVVVSHGVAVSCIGWQMGKTVLIDRPMVTNQQINTLMPDPSKADTRFVYYSLAARRNDIFQLGAAGSRTPILNKTGFEAIEISLPPLPEQKAIAAVLGALDDKIESNRRMNETLEAMARALFQSWFVDFDPVRAKSEGRRPEGMDDETAGLFPAGFEESAIGMIPTGWRAGSILQDARLLSGGTPKTDVSGYWDGNIAWASAKDVSQCSDTFLLSTERTITERGVTESSTRIIPAASTVVVARGATTGRLTMFGYSMAMNQTCYGLHSKNEADFWLFCHARLFMDRVVHGGHGSIFRTITTTTFEATAVLLPPKELQLAFERRAVPLFEKIRTNLLQSRTLADLRDSLLPKLLSGELRVT